MVRYANMTQVKSNSVGEVILSFFLAEDPGDAKRGLPSKGRSREVGNIVLKPEAADHLGDQLYEVLAKLGVGVD